MFNISIIWYLKCMLKQQEFVFFSTFALIWLNLRTCYISRKIFDDTIFQYAACYYVQYECLIFGDVLGDCACVENGIFGLSLVVVCAPYNSHWLLVNLDYLIVLMQWCMCSSRSMIIGLKMQRRWNMKMTVMVAITEFPFVEHPVVAYYAHFPLPHPEICYICKFVL